LPDALLSNVCEVGFLHDVLKEEAYLELAQVFKTHQKKTHDYRMKKVPYGLWQVLDMLGLMGI